MKFNLRVDAKHLVDGGGEIGRRVRGTRGVGTHPVRLTNYLAALYASAGKRG